MNFLAGLFWAVVLGVVCVTPANACTPPLPPNTALKNQWQAIDVAVIGTFFDLGEGKGFIVPERTLKGQSDELLDIRWLVEKPESSAASPLAIQPICGISDRLVGGDRNLFALLKHPDGDYRIIGRYPATTELEQE